MLALHLYVLLLAAGGPLLAPLAHEGHGGEESSPCVVQRRPPSWPNRLVC
jgi:hypothetical protein